MDLRAVTLPFKLSFQVEAFKLTIITCIMIAYAVYTTDLSFDSHTAVFSGSLRGIRFLLKGHHEKA